MNKYTLNFEIEKKLECTDHIYLPLSMMQNIEISTAIKYFMLRNNNKQYIGRFFDFSDNELLKIPSWMDFDKDEPVTLIEIIPRNIDYVQIKPLSKKFIESLGNEFVDELSDIFINYTSFNVGTIINLNSSIGVQKVRITELKCNGKKINRGKASNKSINTDWLEADDDVSDEIPLCELSNKKIIMLKSENEVYPSESERFNELLLKRVKINPQSLIKRIIVNRDQFCEEMLNNISQDVISVSISLDEYYSDDVPFQVKREEEVEEEEVKVEEVVEVKEVDIDAMRKARLARYG